MHHDSLELTSLNAANIQTVKMNRGYPRSGPRSLVLRRL